MEDNRRIKTRNIADMTIEDLRFLVKWCDNQRETWWRPEFGDVSVASILALYHAANDAGYAGMDEWYSDTRASREACLAAWAMHTRE
jgi:hypothetical protein